MADLLGELVSLLFNFPKKYKGERGERERERERERELNYISIPCPQ